MLNYFKCFVSKQRANIDVIIQMKNTLTTQNYATI